MKTIFERSGASWEVLINCDGKYINQLSRHTDRTYSHVSKMVKSFVEDGLVSIHTAPTNKRAKVITLTSKGKQIKDKLQEIKTIMGGT